MPLSRRDHLMTVARDLFMEHGFHGTGIDRILGEAGVSKKTLYTHFRSKDELILAVLKEHDGSFRNHFMRQVEQISPDPRARLMAVFDVAEAWFETPNFFGCVFINAVGEYSKTDTPIRNACRDFKRQMTDFIVQLAKETGAADYTSLGNQLSLLLEGAIVTAQVSDRETAINSARSAAAVLIDNALNDQVIEH
ncbi:TetR/AcrR family transcriptional regulator [Parvibaculaceae bacterium PLY_AMNH_Bact1]|nr:TetR/AcrR family transcriptional regulator [Parvibaculaceae bacterium PLY_AMNH_Bact1]